MNPYFVTTPIYYVNDRPHLGHVYTTVIADVVARYARLRGERVVLSTGTDEHAAKVVATARARGMAPREWADANAAAFRRAFERFDVEASDFIRTSEPRHVEMVRSACARLCQTACSRRRASLPWKLKPKRGGRWHDSRSRKEARVARVLDGAPSGLGDAEAADPEQGRQRFRRGDAGDP